ncbi:MAG: hypothetical protein O3B42_03745, partial [Actinomycetota bacterium]|nr:hypothetical protein [Actinomycetota bacterium]
MQGDDTLTILRLACAPHPPGSQARPSPLEGGPIQGRIPITEDRAAKRIPNSEAVYRLPPTEYGR